MEAGSESNVKKFDKNALLMVLFVASALIVGVFIGVFLPREPVPLVALGGTQGTCPDVNTAFGNNTAQIVPIGETELKSKVTNFLENSDTLFFGDQPEKSLKDNGYSVEVTNIENFTQEVYAVQYNILKDEQIAGQLELFVLADGTKARLLGKEFDLKEPIVYVEPPKPTVAKAAKPEMSLYIFSYCPAGTSALSAFSEVGKVFGEKANMKVKFFSNMHGEHEKQQNMIQECIQVEEPSKFWDYASQFVKDIYPKCGSTRDANCDMQESIKLMETIGIDSGKVLACVKEKGESLYNGDIKDASSNNLQYSPSLVISNLSLGADFDRDAEGIKETLCSAFTTEPAECSQTLSEQAAATTGAC
ncbi:MAG: hypothetical protein V1493_01630 [Candidatus Diapherotrites archaeon]